MSLITTDYNNALSHAYRNAEEHGWPMEIYSRLISVNYEFIQQFVSTPNISDEIPDDWKLEVIIGIAE